MNYFAGLDASLEWTSACVVHADGGIVREAKVASEPAGPRGVLHRAGLRRDAHLLEAVRADPVCRRLMTVPGAGPVTALTFRASVDVPSRFARSRSVGAHFGLAPRKWQSGEVDRTGRISRCGDAMMRAALYEAANALLGRTRGGHG